MRDSTANNSKKYRVELIQDSTIYTKELEIGY